VIGNVVKRFSTEKNTKEVVARMNGKKTKIAVVMSGGRVAEHFGRCEEVMIAEVETGKIKSREILPAPPHDCSALPNLFVEKGVESVIAGGIGGGAINNLNRAGVRVYAGVEGSPEDALESLLAGTLTPGAEACGGAHGDRFAH